MLVLTGTERIIKYVGIKEAVEKANIKYSGKNFTFQTVIKFIMSNLNHKVSFYKVYEKLEFKPFKDLDRRLSLFLIHFGCINEKDGVEKTVGNNFILKIDYSNKTINNIEFKYCDSTPSIEMSLASFNSIK